MSASPTPCDLLRVIFFEVKVHGLCSVVYVSVYEMLTLGMENAEGGVIS